MTDTPETDELKQRESSAADWSNQIQNADLRVGRMKRELTTITEQRDRLAEVLQSIRSGYGGQMTDPDCGCEDCKFLINMDEALQYLTQKEL